MTLAAEIARRAAKEEAKALHAERRAAFEMQYVTLYRMMWKNSGRFTRNTYDREDLVQETFLAALREVDAKGAHRSPRAWLHWILSCTARRYLNQDPYTRTYGVKRRRFVLLDDARAHAAEAEKETT